jgi:DNA-binding CsgD family transcriptional regulator
MLAYFLSWRDGNREETLSLLGIGFGWNLLFHGRDLDALAVVWSIAALLGVDELHRAAGWCETVAREAVSHGHYGHLVPPGIERGRRQAAYGTIESVAIGPGLVRRTVEAEVREVRGRLRCARGWQQQGLIDLREGGRLCESLLSRNPIIWPWRASLAAALALDCPDEAQQLAQENLSNARRSGIPRAIGVALRTLAGLGHDDSVELLRAAVEALKDAPAPLELARAFADLGSALRRQGHRVEAREPLREALEIAARCGALPLMEWVQGEALAAGARPRRPRLRGVDALTPSELRVARLAAEGRSNREIAQALFITAKTVADHLSSSYSKLDITSRDQLTAALGLSNV